MTSLEAATKIVHRETRIAPLPARWQQGQTRRLTNSTALLKKGGKVTRPESNTEEIDPCDFSELEDGISKAQSKLKDDLSKLRAGGRFNPEMLENLRVQVIKGSKATERLADLAQVIPRGRSLNLIVGEKDVRIVLSGMAGKHC